MSLRNLGVFSPLISDHPSIGTRCWKCNTIFGQGSRLGLIPSQTRDETGSYTVKAEPVCATCYLGGEEVLTPIGNRIVERIKDGDGSPFPVITKDGNQWKDSEVMR